MLLDGIGLPSWNINETSRFLGMKHAYKGENGKINARIGPGGALGSKVDIMLIKKT